MIVESNRFYDKSETYCCKRFLTCDRCNFGACSTFYRFEINLSLLFYLPLFIKYFFLSFLFDIFLYHKFKNNNLGLVVCSNRWKSSDGNKK